MGDMVSFASGLVLLYFGILTMIAYRPRGPRRRSDGPNYLAAAIFLGFMAHVGNTVFWQVFGQPAVYFGWVEVSTLRTVGDWFDLLFKGGGALAGYLHLKAMWLQIEEGDRHKWRVLDMPWYPDRRTCLRLLGQRLMRRKQ